MAGNVIAGYAAKFDDEVVIAGEWREKLARGCFTRALRGSPDILALINHDYGRVLGRTTAGNLKLREDSVGLHFELDADPSTPSGMEALGNVRRQDVHGMSFGFRVRAEEWQDGGSSLPLRVIKDVDLYEVSACSMPAYPSTTAVLATASSRAAERAAEAMRRRGIIA